MKKKEELPDCPVATTVSLIGSKWKMLIMRNLLVRPWRFTRTVYAEVPPRVEYSLSELGESMRPIIKSMEDFGIQYKKLAEKNS